MLVGRFEPSSGRPFLEAQITFARPSAAGEVLFLVDTGSDRTLMHPYDAARLSLTGTLEGDPVAIGGTGGRATYVRIAALVSFAGEAGPTYSYELDLPVAVRSPAPTGLPSLLGRDILDRWRMTYSPSEGRLEFNVLSADLTLEP